MSCEPGIICSLTAVGFCRQEVLQKGTLIQKANNRKCRNKKGKDEKVNCMKGKSSHGLTSAEKEKKRAKRRFLLIFHRKDIFTGKHDVGVEDFVSNFCFFPGEGKMYQAFYLKWKTGILGKTVSDPNPNDPLPPQKNMSKNSKMD